MSSPHHGRHEHGQNFLHDRGVIDAIVKIVPQTDGPIVEVGVGRAVGGLVQTVDHR